MNLKSKSYVVLGVFMLVFSVGVVSLFYPSIDDLFVRNPFWNGLSEVYNMLDPIRVNDLDVLYQADPSNSTLLVIGPSTGFTVEEVEAVRLFTERGGIVVVADDFGSGNELLAGLGLDVRFTGDLLQDSVFYDLEYVYPRLLNFSSFNLNREVVLNYATTLSDGRFVTIIESSSPFSFVEYNDVIEINAFPVLGCVDIEDGKLVVLSDSSLWINGMIRKEGNRALLLSLIRGSVYVDEVHRYPSLLSSLSLVLGSFYELVKLIEIRYSFVLLIAISLWFYSSKPSGEPTIDEIEELLNLHSGWDREQITWLHRQRRTNSGD